jgi:hypothetical protein
MNKIEEIKKLKSLLDEGAITQDEFDSLKKSIISTETKAKDTLVNQNSNLTNEKQKQLIKPDTGNKTYREKTDSKRKDENSAYKNNSTEWEDNNEATLNLSRISWVFGLVLGIVFAFRYNFYAFLLAIGLSIGASIAINRLVPKLLHRNMLLGGLSVVLLLLIIFPIGNARSFSKIDISDEQAVLKDMQGTWVGYDHEAGVYTHYKLYISGENFRGWISSGYTDDEPSWSSIPDVTGTFSLSPVQGYSNASGKYRNINFDDNDGNLLEARSLQNMIIYDDGQGLYVVGWASMSKK